jgi:hypothetical protein
MGITISSGSLNLSQNHITHYNTNVKSSQIKDETEKAPSSMASKKLERAEKTSTEDTLLTETSEQGDTLTLSKQGMQMSQSSASLSTETTTSTDSSSTDLSSYTEAELKEKLNSGEITQTEYNNEIQSRASKDSKVTDTTTQSLQFENSMASQLSNLKLDGED